MKFLLRRVKTLHPEHKANGTAAAVAILAIAFLQLECQPRPAGADTIRMAVARPMPVITARPQPAALPAADQELTPEQLTARNLAKKVELLERGIKFLSSMPDYTALFTKREVVNGELLDEQTMSMKIRHAPFSVYLKWQDYDTGREVLYIDGVNDGKMLVHAGGWKARLPALLLAPDSSLAMQEARHPISRAGLLNLATSIVEYNRRDLAQKIKAVCQQLDDQQIGDRDCYCFAIEYADREQSREYRKSMTLIDKEWCVPLFIRNYAWPNEDAAVPAEELDDATLVEQYTYSDVKFRSSLTAADFDDTNEDYRFRRQ